MRVSAVTPGATAPAGTDSGSSSAAAAAATTSLVGRTSASRLDGRDVVERHQHQPSGLARGDLDESAPTLMSVPSWRWPSVRCSEHGSAASARRRRAAPRPSRGAHGGGGQLGDGAVRAALHGSDCVEPDHPVLAGASRQGRDGRRRGSGDPRHGPDA